MSSLQAVPSPTSLLRIPTAPASSVPSLTGNGDPSAFVTVWMCDRPSQAPVGLWVPDWWCCLGSRVFRRRGLVGGSGSLEKQAFESHNPIPGSCCSLLAGPPWCEETQQTLTVMSWATLPCLPCQWLENTSNHEPKCICMARLCVCTCQDMHVEVRKELFLSFHLGF